MTAKTLEFWFDFSCPYAYLASTQVEALAERAGAKLIANPVLLGGIFRAVGTDQKLFATLGAAKAAHNGRDLDRHAKLWDVPLRFPESHPMRTVTALRALLVVGEPFMPLAHAFYRAYWDTNDDLADPDVLARILREHGHDADDVLARCSDDAVKAELRRRTDEAIELGFFGVPGFRVGEEIFWGQDRMHFVEAALGGSPDTVARVAHRPEGEVYPVDFYFDYSSPFSYLAAMRVPDYLGPHARWKPMLLGGVFKSVGTANVPLFEASPAKQRYLQMDCNRQAQEAQADFRWPSRFPMNTVLPLRMTILAQKQDAARAQDFIRAIYVGFWAHDLDISNPEVMASIANDCGFDGAALVAGTQDQAIKDTLRANTEGAVRAGVFGAPSFVVHAKDNDPPLYWGNDRLPLVTRAAQGDARVI